MGQRLEALLGDKEEKPMTLKGIREGLSLCDEMTGDLIAVRNKLGEDPNYRSVLEDLNAYKEKLLERASRVEQMIIGLNKYMIRLMGE